MLQAHELGNVVALGHGVEQIADARQGVAAFQHLRDHPQPGQMLVVVDAYPATSLRRWNQASILIGADVAHGGGADVRQLINGVALLLAPVGGGAGFAAVFRSGAHAADHRPSGEEFASRSCESWQ